MRSSYSEMVHVQGTRGVTQLPWCSLGTKLERKCCRYLQRRSGGWGRNRHLKNPKQLIQQGEIINLCSELSYHPSKAQPRICLRTGGGAWPRCHSGGPCSSSATHLPCSPPAEQPKTTGWEQNQLQLSIDQHQTSVVFSSRCQCSESQTSKLRVQPCLATAALGVPCWASLEQFKVPQLCCAFERVSGSFLENSAIWLLSYWQLAVYLLTGLLPK